MRDFLEYDEIYTMIKEDMGTSFNEKRFAVGALAARIYEELVIWQRLNEYLEVMKSHSLEPEELDEYRILSKKSESLTQLIVKSVRDLDISNNKSVEELMDRLDEQMLGGLHDKENETTDRTTPDDD